MSNHNQIDQFFVQNSMSHISIGLELTPDKKKTVKKQYGRWNIFESQEYLEVLKLCCNHREVIKQLKIRISNRMESQIRAHHQKMLKKYGNIQNIIEMAGRSENNGLLQINKKLTCCLRRITRVASLIPSNSLDGASSLHDSSIL